MKRKNVRNLIVPLIVSTLAFPVFFAQAGWNIGTISGFGLPDGSIYVIVVNILNWLLGLVGVVGIIGFAISGIMYLISAGDEKMAGTAKNAMKFSIIGIIVALSGYVLIQAVEAMLRAESFF